MGKKGTKRKTRWRVLPIGGEDGCNGVCSNNEDEVDGDRDSASPLNNSTTTGTSYARASAQQRMPRTKPTTTSYRGGSYNYRHRSYYQQPHDSNQPLVTAEKKTFNEEEYTKITTPRQDVLFKKGYLGRKRPTAAPTADTTANGNSSSNPDNSAADVANGNLDVEQNGEPIENDQTTSSDMLSPVEEQPQYIYATNGYVDQSGGPPPGLYYINGSGYELYDPYSGNVTVVVGPAPHYGGPGGGPPVLAAVPCQPLPLQPLEWFNPAFLPYVTAPCHNGLATARDRRKRYSTDSQNCSPQSSESTEPPGSPQECDMEATQVGEPPGPAIYTQAPAYVYPGYMFGPPMYNVNGVTVQGAPTQPPICDVTGSNKRRKKKKRRRRRRGGAEDGSEESSSDEKELEEPMSVTSQESSSQEIESDSKQSTTLNNDSSTSSPLSSCQTLTTTDLSDTTSTIPAAADSAASPTQLNAFDSEISIKQIPPLVNTQQSSLGQENISVPSASKQDRKDTSSDHNCNFKPVVKEREEQLVQEFSKQSMQITKDSSEDLNSTQLLKDQTETEEVDLLSNHLEPSVNNQDTPCVFTIHHSANHSTSETQNESNGTLTTRVHTTELHSSENKTQETESGVQCNGDITSSVSNESIIKTEESAKPLKQKKSGKQANVKHKKNSKGKEEKQKEPKISVANNLKRESKKKDDVINDGPFENENIAVNVLTHHTSPVNSIPSEITTEVATLIQIDSPTQEAENTNSFQKEDLNLLLNGLDDKSQISNSEAKDNSVTEMDGNENKSISAEEYTQAGRSSHGTGNGNGKPDLFPDFKSSCAEPPTKPVRKEKQKSSPINALPPDQHLSDVSTISSITAKSLQLPQISLRPDAPKTEAKSLHEVSLSQKLKGTADILESITAALTAEPPITKTLQVTVHKDNLVSQETRPSHENAEPAPVEKATEQKLPYPHEEISGQTTAVSMKGESDLNKMKHKHEKLKPFASTSSQEESEVKNKAVVLKDQSKEVEDEVQPPVPPPRGKKLNALKHKLTEVSQTPQWDLEGDNLTDESSGDSTTSSTTHESEESVIELLSSTHTSPDDRLKQDLSSDEEEEDIIFTVENSRGKAEIMDIKSIPPDKSHVFTPSISGPSLQDSSQISGQDEPTTSKTPPKPSEANSSLKYAEMYSDELSNIIICEAISESSKKRICLPITEAVTRWLRSQSPEVLSLPPPEDETESEVSSEEQESDERTEETGNQKQLTGQKNVFCNPLPVPLLEDCGPLSVNSDVNHSGYNNGTGRRVALNDSQYLKLGNENIVSDKNDNNRNTVSISTAGYKRLISGHNDNVCISSIKGNCDPLTSVTNSDCGKHECQCQIMAFCHGESILTQCPKKVARNVNRNSQRANCPVNISDTVRDGFNHRNIRMDTMKDGLQSRVCLTNDRENSFQNISQDVCDIATSSSEPTITNPSSASCRLEQNVLLGRKLKNINNRESIFEKSKSNFLRDDECSFTSEETLECEWDLWDYNPAKLPSALTTPKNQTPVEEILAKTPDDFCSHMCDPTVSVAKYYSLGALQKKAMKDEDETDSTDSNDEEVDALKHFQHELKEDDDDGLHTAPLPCTSTGNLDKKLDEDLESNNIYGNPEIYKSHYGESCSVSNSGIQCQEEAHRCRNMYNATLLQRAQAAHLFHKKSSVLVSKLKGDGPFPCGGICCILQ